MDAEKMARAIVEDGYGCSSFEQRILAKEYLKLLEQYRTLRGQRTLYASTSLSNGWHGSGQPNPRVEGRDGWKR